MLLDRLMAQSYRPREIIVVDGGSTDRTREIVQEYVDRGVRLIELGPAYPGRARNRGIDSANDEWIALIDAGCEPSENWLEELVKPALDADHPPAVVFGRYDPRIRTEWEVAEAVTIVPPVDPVSGIRSPSTASLLLHRSAWHSLGGFPDHLRAAEDLAFFERLKVSALPVAYTPKAVVYWTLPASLGQFFKRLRLYSAHHLRAGLFRTWHFRVMAMDLAGVGLFALATAWPGLALLAVILGGARVLGTVRRRRHNAPGINVFRPDRLTRVVVLLGLADAATWAGAIDLLTARGESPRQRA
jgi:glycosyltransferase involved in cell wall biosynthesis